MRAGLAILQSTTHPPTMLRQGQLALEERAALAACKGALAWPKATSLLARRLARKGRRKGSLRLPKMPWQGHLACQQPPRPRSRQVGLASSGKRELLAATAGNAGLVACLANADSNSSCTM